MVAVNRRPGDTDDEVALVKRLALEAGAHGAEVNEGFERGGEGASALAEAVVAACEQPSDFQLIYDDDDSIEVKIEKMATKVYGASDVDFYLDAQRKIRQYNEDGLNKLPICMAKTHLSLSADPALLNAPEDFVLPVRDIRAYTGAGWLVPLCGRHPADARPGQVAGGAERGHRRGRADGRPLLSAVGGLAISSAIAESEPASAGPREGRPSLVDIAEDALRTWLATGRHRPGERLPPEQELSAHLGISRGTLRTALRRLEESGEIVRRQGSGTYVGRAELDEPRRGAREARLLQRARTPARRDARTGRAGDRAARIGPEPGEVFGLDPETRRRPSRACC